MNIINKSDDYYTSSSCSGRIVLIELPEIGDKKEAKFLGKWHREILRNELEIAVYTILTENFEKTDVLIIE